MRRRVFTTALVVALVLLAVGGRAVAFVRPTTRKELS
jgi:hypothetical protein